MSVRVEGLIKHYGAQRALDDVTLDVQEGSLTALLGPSGSGKTTLLRIVAGLEIADRGTVHLSGRDVTQVGVRARNVGFVFQHYALFRHLTVFENVAFGLRVRPRRQRPHETAIRAKVKELLELVQLGEFEARLPNELSGGQRQRVALARALAVEPAVLLLDEPFGALDAQVRHELRRWLRDLHERLSVTSLFVTHDQEEALEVAGQVAVLNKGRIEQVGTPDEVYHEPQNEFVMGFLGRAERFDGESADGELRFGGWRLAAPRGHSVRGATNVWMRPHDWEVDRTKLAAASVRCRVAHLFHAGAHVQVELALPDERIVRVELSQRRQAALALAPGDQVELWPRSARAFAVDAHTSHA